MSKTEYSRRTAMKTILILAAAWIGTTSLLPVVSAIGGESEAINIGSRRELFVDHFLTKN